MCLLFREKGPPGSDSRSRIDFLPEFGLGTFSTTFHHTTRLNQTKPPTDLHSITHCQPINVVLSSVLSYLLPAVLFQSVIEIPANKRLFYETSLFLIRKEKYILVSCSWNNLLCERELALTFTVSQYTLLTLSILQQNRRTDLLAFFAQKCVNNVWHSTPGVVFLTKL